MKKSYFTALLIAVAAVLWILSGTVMESGAKTEEQPAPVTIEAKTAESVRVRESAAESVSTDILVTGRSYASRAVDIRAEIEGQVLDILYEKGAAVNKGDVIARLEERDRKARTAEARERLAQREIEYNAAKELEVKGFNSKVRLAQARADLEAARAELKKAEVEFGNTEIKAPFGGVISGQDVEAGDYVSPGDMLFGIVDLDPVEVHGFVTERQVGDIAPGGAARAVFVGGKEEQGAVTYVAPAANEQTRTFKIEITVPNPDNAISQGMTARIYIPTPERKVHKISPSVLSLNDEGRIGVKIVDREDKVRFMPVNIVQDYPDHMLVEGLPDKIRLITVGQDFVKDGQSVTPVAADGDGLL